MVGEGGDGRMQKGQMAVAVGRWGWQKCGKGQEFRMGAVRGQTRALGWDTRQVMGFQKSDGVPEAGGVQDMG